MIRKTILIVAAAAALGTTALAPTTASAAGGGWHGHHHHGHGHGHSHRWHRGFGFYGPAFPVYAGYRDCTMKKRWVATPRGERLRWVQVCY
jgi:hypothetical protein